MTLQQFWWLLKNEIRLWWRQTTSTKQFWIWVAVLGFFVLGSIFLLWISLESLRAEMPAVASDNLPDVAVWSAITLSLAAFFFAFNQAIGTSVVVLFERGDLDLLLSSPLSSRVIFAVRLLSVSLTLFAGFCFFAIPASLLAVLVGLPQLLGIYPALISICLVAASAGMLVTLGLVRLIGARRARTWVQVLNLISTLIFILGLQLPNFLQTTDFSFDRLSPSVQSWIAPGSLFNVDSWIWFPARAVWFDLPAVVLTLVGSGAIATLTVFALSQAFIQGTQQSITRKHRPRDDEGTTLQEGFRRVTLTKEWRMMRRSPYLISQTALQILLVLPITWVVLQGNGSGENLNINRATSFAMPFLGGQLSYAFTYVCLSGEEAADLLKAAPVAKGSLRRLKQLAALVPVWLCAVRSPHAHPPQSPHET